MTHKIKQPILNFSSLIPHPFQSRTKLSPHITNADKTNKHNNSTYNSSEITSVEATLPVINHTVPRCLFPHPAIPVTNAHKPNPILFSKY